MVLEAKKINKSFGAHHVLKDISLSIKSGRAYGLLGRNGSGKTTTIRVLMNFFESDSGEVFFDGVKNSHSKLKIGYLPEERGLYPKRVILEQMIYFGELRGMKPKDAKKSAEELLGKLDAEEYLKKKLDTLSKGNQQKIQLAVSIINDPDIVILDEPFSGLDPVNAKLLKDLVRELVDKGKIVLFSSHQMANVEEFCDDICIINKGEVVLAGDLDDIKDTYPKNNIIIDFDDNNSNAIDNLFKNDQKIKDIVVKVEKEAKGYNILLKHDNDKNVLLNSIIGNNINIKTFMVARPSLEEIFIEKVGDIVHE